MLVVWDEFKRAANLLNHRLDFVNVRDRFVFETATIIPSYAGRGDRPRFVAIGPLDHRLIAVVFSPLGMEAISLISVRPASRRERRLYEQI